MDLVLGIDVGGTSIKAGVFSTAGELLGETNVRTPELTNEAAYDKVVSSLNELVSWVAVPDPYVIACGLDIPGPICEDGTVGFLSNAVIDLDGLKGAIRANFPNAYLNVVNDANAAAIGEMWQGAARDYKSFVCCTLGTGVGGAVVIDGELVLGKNGSAGEIGHMTVNPNEPRSCGCGRKGCLEQYASATGLVRLYRYECEAVRADPYPIAHNSDAYAVFKALEAGDPNAKRAISMMCEYLAVAFAQIGTIVDPGAYVIGGGVAGSLDVFHDELVERYRRHCLPIMAGVPIVSAKLGNQAGMYGSAYEALRGSHWRRIED